MFSAVPRRRVDSMNKQHTRTITLVTSLSICIAAFTGCSSAYTGPATTQEREIDTVNAVELDTSGELIVTRGEHIGLTVTAGEKVIDRLTSDVEDEVLHLGLDGEPLAWGGDIRYELTIRHSTQSQFWDRETLKSTSPVQRSPWFLFKGRAVFALAESKPMLLQSPSTALDRSP